MNIAIIEDSKIISHMVTAGLISYGFNVTNFRSNKIDEHKLASGVFETVILNTKLDHVDSIALIKGVKDTQPQTYILAINSKQDWKVKVDILNVGADDVISYPFPMQELLARIQALLRRPRESKDVIYRFRGLTIDPNCKTVEKDNDTVPLRKKEFHLLTYLARNKNRPVSRHEILDNVWDYRHIIESNTVDVHVSKIRKSCGDKNLIQTIHGFGYQLNDKSDHEYEKMSSVVDDSMKMPPVL